MTGETIQKYKVRNTVVTAVYDAKGKLREVHLRDTNHYSATFSAREIAALLPVVNNLHEVIIPAEI